MTSLTKNAKLKTKKLYFIAYLKTCWAFWGLNSSLAQSPRELHRPPKSAWNRLEVKALKISVYQNEWNETTYQMKVCCLSKHKSNLWLQIVQFKLVFNRPCCTQSPDYVGSISVLKPNLSYTCLTNSLTLCKKKVWTYKHIQMTPSASALIIKNINYVSTNQKIFKAFWILTASCEILNLMEFIHGQIASALPSSPFITLFLLMIL